MTYSLAGLPPYEERICGATPNKLDEAMKAPRMPIYQALA